MRADTRGRFEFGVPRVPLINIPRVEIVVVLSVLFLLNGKFIWRSLIEDRLVLMVGPRNNEQTKET